MTSTEVTTPRLDAFVADCRAAAAGPDARQQVVALMKDLVADPSELAGSVPPMASYDSTPSGDRLGGDVVLFEDETVTIVLVDTLPGVLQPPHDHLMTAIIGMFEGCEKQRFFARTANGVTPTPGRDLGPGEVVVIGTDGIHAISTDDELARGVHVYLGSLSTVKRSIFHPEGWAPGLTGAVV